MIPELTNPTIISEGASTGCESMMADIPANAITTEPKTESIPLTSRASFYLHRVPSGSRQWEMYLQDMVESKRKLSQRVASETESINDFLNRFPICETSTKPITESIPLTSRASFYLHRVPSGSRQWKMYLADLVESKRKLSQRVARETESINDSQRVASETESINDFLNRFPIC